MATREDATNNTNTTNLTQPKRNPRSLYTDAPAFVHDRPILLGRRPRPPLKFGGSYKIEDAGSDSESPTSQQDVPSPPVDDSAFSTSPVATSTTLAETTNWLNSRNRKSMRLGEAWDRTDENNGFKPRTSPGIARTKSAQGQSTTESRLQAGAFRARTAQGHTRTSSGPERVVRQGRIARSNTYSTSPKGVQTFSSSPPTTLAKAYARAEREERQTPAPRESESETSSVVGAGSPSPAAREKPRWNTDYAGKTSTKKSVEDFTGDELDKHVRQFTKGQESPKIQEDRPRSSTRADNHRERIRKALESTKPVFVKKRIPLDIDRPFASRRSRAEVGPKVAETTRELARKSSMSSLGSLEDEPLPPPNVPRTWGSKARQRPGWIQKILSPENSEEAKEGPPATVEEAPESSADTPLPSVEVASVAQELTPPASRPASAQPQNMSEYPDPSRIWDADVDFTATSLQISESPILRIRPTKLDEIQAREIESLTARAVATNRLEEIRERNSEERDLSPASVHRFSKSPTPEPSKKETAKPDPKETAKPVPPKEVSHEERQTIIEEGHQIPDTPIIEYVKDYRPDSSSSATSKEDAWDALRKLSRLLSPKISRPPSIKDEDEEKEKEIEVEIVTEKQQEEVEPVVQEAEKLSKVVAQVAEKPEEPVEKESLLRNKNLEVDGSKRHSTASTPPKSDVDPEERITAEAKLFELQDSKSERNSIHGPSRSRSFSPAEEEKIDETPRPVKTDPLSLPTPKVTGAYIETPATSVRRPRKPHSDSPRPSSDIYEPDDDLASLDNIHRIRSSSSQRSSASGESSSQRTALENSYRSRYRSSRRGSEGSRSTRSTSSRRASDNEHILRDASPERDAIPIEQARNSPRPLINTAKINTAAEDLRLLQLQAGIEDNTLDDFDAMIENEDIAIPTTDTVTSDPTDSLTYDEEGELLSKRERERRLELHFLERMSTRLRNTSSNIRQAKQGIERLESQVSATPVLTQTSATPILAETTNQPHFIHVDIKVQVPQLWTYTEPARPEGRHGAFWNRKWKFTWIGLILFIFAAWYIAESAMCSAFCKPQYSSKATWKYSDPLFPYAIPTKLDQWTGKVVSNVPTKLAQWWLGDPVGVVHPGVGTIEEDELI